MEVNTTLAAANMASNITSEISPLATFLGRAAYEAHLIRPLLPTYLHLIFSALFPIWIAAHGSLVRPTSAAKPASKSKDSGSDDDAEPEEVSQKLETLTPSDAVLFPVLAGVTLATLYFILKYLEDPAWLNWGMNLYFSQMGLFFAYGFLVDAFATARSAIFPRCYSWRGGRWELDNNSRQYVLRNGRGAETATHTSPLPGILRLVPMPAFARRFIWRCREVISAKSTLTLHLRGIVTLRATPTLLDFAALILAAVVTYVHTFVAKPWQLTNFLGLSFCYGSLQLTSPSTAWTGTLLLSALFFYDIYFVFFTPIMVHVATNLDVPIKMLFPRPDGCILPVGAEDGSAAMEEYLKCLGKKRAMAMLGLGDIVVPGLVIAFALRWDLWLHYLKLQKTKPVSAADAKNADDEDKTLKEAYRPATGAWGERFWTAAALWPASLEAKSFKKTYFKATVVGYVIGMSVTVGVMQIAKHAQPALLYLVPGVLGALWGTALVKGEVKLLWNYVEDAEEENEKDKKDHKKEQKALENGSSEKAKEVDQDDTVHNKQSALVKRSKTKKPDADSADDTDDDKKNQSTSKPSLAKDMKAVRQHAIYFALKLPSSSRTKDKATSKTGPPSRKSALAKLKSSKTRRSPKDAQSEIADSADNLPSPADSASSSSAADDDDDDDKITVQPRRRTRKSSGRAGLTASASPRVLRSSGSAVGGGGGADEETLRGAKRQRKA